MLKKNKIQIILFLLITAVITPQVQSEEYVEKKSFIFSTYFKNKFSLDSNSLGFSVLDLKNEIDMAFSMPINFYTSTFWFNDIFLIDFLPIFYYPDMAATDLLYNSFTTGIDNSFKIKKALRILSSFEFGVNSPFYSATSLYFNPIVGLSGNYYFGYFWNIEQSFPIEYTPAENLTVFTTSTYCKAGYEFFRFYGPRNFKLGILASNTLELSYPNIIYDNELYDEFKSGTYISFYDVYISLYFILENYMDLSINELYSRAIGINTGIKYSKKGVTLSIDYTGYIDDKSDTLEWTSRVDAYIKVNLYKIHKK